MTEVINNLNEKYNELVEELFEEVLCDKCRRSIRIGNMDGKLVNMLNQDTLFLCKECNKEIMKQIKQN